MRAAVWALLGLLCLAGGLVGQTSAPFSHGPLVVSQNHRFLQHKDGTPFFWLGDTAWLLFQQLTCEEAERYLEDRQAKGFTVIQVMLLHTAADHNAYGAPALVDKDPAKPAEKPGHPQAGHDYWAHVDWVLASAARHGLYVAMVPAWGTLVKKRELNDQNVAVYAGWLAARYKDHPNVIWMTGGDIQGDVHKEVWRKMGQTLRHGDPNHLITFHPFGRTRSATWFHHEPWLDFNMFQSGHRSYEQDTEGPDPKGEDNWRYVAEDYVLTPVKPTIDGEPSYEQIPRGLHDKTQPRWNENDCRRYAYWSVFAGAFGHTYGDNSVMQMYKPADKDPSFTPKKPWYEAMDDPGAGQMQFLAKLVQSRPFFERVPDQSIVAGENGTRYERVAVTRGKAYLFAYTYTGRPFELNLGVLPGEKLMGWWYSPRDGKAKSIGLLKNEGVKKFTPPGTPAEGNDWVLVLDSVEQGFPAPGTVLTGD
ncbi:glycoside hydrolase family 140 protein [uncultured Paludibaculum sp.]|uniref:glycoside hydrolase family 140 protein n=1 Tax=uncultured Paludibaculum sp. TaxID=1765020 RepID=UPI002AAB3B21|nr:glycoside hydrolase family 140 protein [uncultured Paludibaculum sp.]